MFTFLMRRQDIFFSLLFLEKKETYQLKKNQGYKSRHLAQAKFCKVWLSCQVGQFSYMENNKSYTEDINE